MRQLVQTVFGMFTMVAFFVAVFAAGFATFPKAQSIETPGAGSNLLTSGGDGDSTTVQSDSGLELVGSRLTLIRGCADNEILKWDETQDDWNCEADDAGGAGVTDHGALTGLTDDDHARYLSTNSDDTFSESTWALNADTLDGSDTYAMTRSAGGGTGGSILRGAFDRMYGNDNAAGGDYEIYTGSDSGSQFRVVNQNTTDGSIYLVQHGSSGTMSFYIDGTNAGFTPHGTGLYFDFYTDLGMKLWDGTDTYSTALSVGAISGNTAFTFPPTNGTNNYALKTDGAGLTSWADPDTLITLGSSVATTELVSPTGIDTNVVTGTAGSNGFCAQWNADGDLVDSGAACPTVDGVWLAGTYGLYYNGDNVIVGADAAPTYATGAGDLVVSDEMEIRGASMYSTQALTWNFDGDLSFDGGSGPAIYFNMQSTGTGITGDYSFTPESFNVTFSGAGGTYELDNTDLTFVETSATGSIKWDGGVGANTGELLSATRTGNRTWTLPDASGEVSLLGQTIAISELATGTDGELITWDASGNPAAVAVGTSGQVLTSNGAGAAPTFQDAAAAGFDYARYDAASMYCMEAANCAVSYVESTTPVESIVRFDDTTAEYVNLKYWVTDALDTSGTVEFSVFVEPVSHDTANVEMCVQQLPNAHDEDHLAAYSTEECSGAVAISASAETWTEVVWTETVSALGWAAGDLVRLRLRRETGSNDTLTGDLEVYAFRIKIPEA